MHFGHVRRAGPRAVEWPVAGQASDVVVQLVLLQRVGHQVPVMAHPGLTDPLPVLGQVGGIDHAAISHESGVNEIRGLPHGLAHHRANPVCADDRVEVFLLVIFEMNAHAAIQHFNRLGPMVQPNRCGIHRFGQDIDHVGPIHADVLVAPSAIFPRRVSDHMAHGIHVNAMSIRNRAGALHRVQQAQFVEDPARVGCDRHPGTDLVVLVGLLKHGGLNPRDLLQRNRCRESAQPSTDDCDPCRLADHSISFAG